jgi:hypothetical protein
MKNLPTILLASALCGCAIAKAQEVFSEDLRSIAPPDSITGLELFGKGKVNRFFSLELTDGANTMLHGYVPQAGDTIEWYVREANCTEPEKSCDFELAIRKAK